MHNEQGDHGVSAGVLLCYCHKRGCNTGVVTETGVFAGWVSWLWDYTLGWSRLGQ